MCALFPFISRIPHYHLPIDLHILSTTLNFFFCTQNVTISFVNNSAVSAGAAIYAINISVCQYTSRMCEDEEKLTTDYQRSIFSGPPFQFE